MFTIYGSKTSFSQWEKDQRVVNPNMTDCEQVAFRMSNGRTGVSRAYEHEGQMVADVPNHLLKYSGNMMVELGQGKNLRIEETTYFPVTKTAKPEEYEETENRNLKKKYIETVKQDLTEAEKEQARENLGINGSGGGATTWDELEGKPFGVIEGIVDILPKTELVSNQDFGGAFTGEISFPPSVGETYTVSYNGVPYETTAQDYDGAIILGNGSEVGIEDTGEPFFAMFYLTVNMIVVLPLDGASKVVMSISGHVKTVKKMDSMFYNAPLVYYTNGDYLYKDIFFASKVTRRELESALLQPIIINTGDSVKYPIQVKICDDYGEVVVAAVYSSTTLNSVMRYYTAEYEG